jgi:sugar phosphate isomerase/epimerase
MEKIDELRLPLYSTLNFSCSNTSMIRPGLVSITFRQLSPQEIIELVQRAELRGIEWGGDVHVPHGETATAREVLRATKAAGLEVAAYGSYYRVGASEDEGLSFKHVLHTAIELEAPLVRVWAGNKNSEDADDEYFNLVVRETQYITEKAAAAGIKIATEFHGGTLCNTADSTRRFLDAVNDPNFQTLWQPVAGLSTPEAASGLQELLPQLANLHVFQWHKTDDGIERSPLEEGSAAWQEYLSLAANSGRDHYALLEFVRDDAPGQFLRDAATLRNWCE